MAVSTQDAPAEQLRRTFLAAAGMMLAERPPTDGAGRALLHTIGYSTPHGPPSVVDRHRAALLRAAADCARIFRLTAPQAPGLFAFGAEIDPVRVAPWSEPRLAGVAGVGVSVRQAFEACVGEGVEYLAQFERGAASESAPERGAGPASGTGTPTGARARGGHAVPSATRLTLAEAAPPQRLATLAEDLLNQNGLPPGTPFDWAEGIRLHDDVTVRLPADLCFRRPPERRVLAPAWPLSIGCAAGPDRDAARLHALLELVERDAAALWWRGGRRGRLPGLDDAATEAAAVMLRSFRQGLTARRSWLLDITTDLGIPCMAAVSCDQDGRGFCCGTAARMTAAEAAQAAVREMCQMELAHDVVQAKLREGGDAALNDIDRRHLARSTGIDTGSCALLHPVPPGPSSDFSRGPGSPLGRLVERLAERGMEAFALDLAGGDLAAGPAVIPVVRVICPGLQPAPSELIGARLHGAIAETGGGDTYTGQIPLM